MTTLAAEAEQCLIIARVFDVISEEEDNLPDSFMMARSFASKVIQVPGTLESIVNITEQVNESIHTFTAITSTYPAPEDFVIEALAPAKASMTEGLILQVN